VTNKLVQLRVHEGFEEDEKTHMHRRGPPAVVERVRPSRLFARVVDLLAADRELAIMLLDDALGRADTAPQVFARQHLPAVVPFLLEAIELVFTDDERTRIRESLLALLAE
jgi:hypothetical protein